MVVCGGKNGTLWGRMMSDQHDVKKDEDLKKTSAEKKGNELPEKKDEETTKITQKPKSLFGDGWGQSLLVAVIVAFIALVIFFLIEKFGKKDNSNMVVGSDNTSMVAADLGLSGPGTLLASGDPASHDEDSRSAPSAPSDPLDPPLVDKDDEETLSTASSDDDDVTFTFDEDCGGSATATTPPSVPTTLVLDPAPMGNCTPEGLVAARLGPLGEELYQEAVYACWEYMDHARQTRTYEFLLESSMVWDTPVCAPTAKTGSTFGRHMVLVPGKTVGKYCTPDPKKPDDTYVCAKQFICLRPYKKELPNRVVVKGADRILIFSRR